MKAFPRRLAETNIVPNRREFIKFAMLAAGAGLAAPAWLRLSGAQADAAAPLDTFEQRRKWVLDTVAADPHRFFQDGFWAAQACFLRGDNAAGLALWKARLLAESKARRRGVELFYLWPAMHCYLKWGHLLDDDGKALMKPLVTTFTDYAGMRTSNLATLARVTRYLAGQAWPAAEFGPRSEWRTDDPDAAKAVPKMVSDAALHGFGEWASWPYFGKNILPILTLSDVGSDSELRRRAGLAFEAGLAQNAPFWLHGRWAMATARSYPDLLSQAPWGGPSVLWLYFGGLTPKLEGDLIGAAVMDYAPPRLIETAARDRSKPYTARARFGGNAQVSFIDGTYGAFCEEQAKPQDWWQSYPYGVMWDDPSPDKHCFLWLTAPLNDDAQGEHRVSVSHPHGVLGRAQSNLQHESALLYVFQFGPQDVFPYALAFIPGGWLAMQDDAPDEGRVYLHYGTVLVAISSSRNFTWDRTAPIKVPSSRPFPGDSEFRVAASPLVMAIETARPEEMPGATPEARLAAFRAAIRAKTKAELVPAPSVTGRYTDRRGIVLERRFQGPGQVGGKPVNEGEGDRLLVESPWVRQTLGGGLTVTDGSTERVYDLRAWTVTETKRAAAR